MARTVKAKVATARVADWPISDLVDQALYDEDEKAKDLVLRIVATYPHTLGHLCGKTLLGELHSKWVHYLWGFGHTGEHRSLQAHRGAYKTTGCAAIGSIYWLLFFPNDRIGMGRKRWSDAWKVCTEVADLITTSPGLYNLFTMAHGIPPVVTKRGEGQINFNFKGSITPEGNLSAFGMESSITGSHYDKVMLDDFVTLRDRTSRAERERTTLVVQEIQTNIIDPGREVMFLGTPWHKMDAWRVCPTPIKFPASQTGILSEKVLAERKGRTTRSLFAINYDLMHEADEDKLLSEPAYREWVKAETEAHLDAKYQGEATAALTFASRRELDGKIQVRGYVFHEDVRERIGWIKTQMVLNKARRIHVETNADKGYTARELRRAGAVVSEYNENMQKHVKIVAYAKGYWDGLVVPPEMQDSEWLEQILDYEEGEKPDDAADSLASLLRQAFYQTVSLDGLYGR